MYFAVLASAVTALRTSTSRPLSNSSTDDEPRRAICIMDPQPNEVARGVVQFEQASYFDKTKIVGEFTGLTPGLHGFHIH